MKYDLDACTFLSLYVVSICSLKENNTGLLWISPEECGPGQSVDQDRMGRSQKRNDAEENQISIIVVKDVSSLLTSLSSCLDHRWLTHTPEDNTTVPGFSHAFSY